MNEFLAGQEINGPGFIEGPFFPKWPSRLKKEAAGARDVLEKSNEAERVTSPCRLASLEAFLRRLEKVFLPGYR